VKKYERKCWNCGHLGMIKQDSYCTCESCGATWNEVLTPGSSPVTEEMVPTYSEGVSAAKRIRRPSGVVKARATRARDLKERVTKRGRGEGG